MLSPRSKHWRKTATDAIQLSYDDKKEKHSNKAEKGHFQKANTVPKNKIMNSRGFVRDWKVGDKITVEYFSDDTWLDIQGSPKAKAFREW
jgi:large subunit ribosomal protein L3